VSHNDFHTLSRRNDRVGDLPLLCWWQSVWLPCDKVEQRRLHHNGVSGRSRAPLSEWLPRDQTAATQLRLWCRL